jgi:nicotinic acid mononucleotide adenylyltransferase
MDAICKHGVVVLERNSSDPSDIIFKHDILFRNRVRTCLPPLINRVSSLNSPLFGFFLFFFFFLKKYNIEIVKQIVANDVSSTAVRLCVKRGLSVAYLVPDQVVDYIEKTQLYK